MSDTVRASDYTNLITSEHQSAANFVATVALSVQPCVDQQNLLLSLPSVFDLDQAIGVQLDAVGAWIGVSRRVPVPIADVYFSLDVAGLGLDEGYLMGPFDPVEGLVLLDDETYRFVLRARIIANTWDGTSANALAALLELFTPTSPGTFVFIQDNYDMTIFFGLSGSIPPPVFQSLVAQGFIPLKPGGVGASYFVTSVAGAPIFGLDVENQYVSGLDVGSLATQL